MVADGTVTSQLVAYHEARARGGAGLQVAGVRGNRALWSAGTHSAMCATTASRSNSNLSALPVPEGHSALPRFGSALCQHQRRLPEQRELQPVGDEPA